MSPAMQAAQVVVLGILGLLAIAAVWVVFRAATAHGLVWGMKRLLVLAVALGLLFAGAWGWVRFQSRLPGGVTVASVEASHAALLARLRAVAGEHDLEKVEGLDEKLSGPETEGLFAPDILQASFVLPRGPVVRAYERPGLGQPRGYWPCESSGPDQACLTRGWLRLQGIYLDTLEHLEPATDASGASVTIQLTLRLDDFRP